MNETLKVWTPEELRQMPIGMLKPLQKSLADYLANVNWVLTSKRDGERIANANSR